MIRQAQLMKISWAFLMAQGCGWLGAYTHIAINSIFVPEDTGPFSIAEEARAVAQ